MIVDRISCGNSSAECGSTGASPSHLVLEDALQHDFGKGDSLKIQVEPILGLPVLKDLVVDMEPFFAHYRQVMPYFVNDTPLPANGRERLQSQEDRLKFDDTTKCILCAACTAACPLFWANGRFIGPQAIVMAHRFVFDSRDQGKAERLAVLNARFGAWGCRDVGNCTEVCPRGIQIQDAIDQCKREVLLDRE